MAGDEKKGNKDPVKENEKPVETSPGSKSIKSLTEHYESQLKHLFEIGIALSSEKDLDRLLEMILDEARRCTYADAGTLYIKEGEELHFKIMQNDTLNTKMGGTSGNPIALPPVALAKENVSAYAALTGETINIPDVYEAEEFDFTGPRRYDKETGYRSKSMLVVPMQNQENEIIGVLQLLNAVNPDTGEVIPFSPNFVQLIQSLASQAAVAITNAQLLKDMERLFDSFVEVMATAIDERSHYTAGHIRRVAELAIIMCDVINEMDEGPFADVHFNKEQLKEMSIAGLMHDVGKVATPIHIMDKETKLQTIFDRVEFIKQRFFLIKIVMQKEWLERKLEMISQGVSGEELRKGDEEIHERLKELQEDLDFLVTANTGGEFMSEEKIARIDKIGSKTYKMNGLELHYLNENEVKNLCIRKGTLLDSERQLMMDHIVVTIKMLEQIPFTKNLSNVLLYAAGHHENLDGTGYPKGLKGDQLTVGARILKLVDFYEALTAPDRPYRKEMPHEKVMAILKSEVDTEKIDGDLFDLFIKEDVPKRFREKTTVKRELIPKKEAAPSTN